MGAQISPQFKRAVEAEVGRLMEAQGSLTTIILNDMKKLTGVMTELDNLDSNLQRWAKTGGPAMKQLARGFRAWNSGLYLHKNKISKVMQLAQKADREN